MRLDPLQASVSSEELDDGQIAVGVSLVIVFAIFLAGGFCGFVGWSIGYDMGWRKGWRREL